MNERDWWTRAKNGISFCLSSKYIRVQYILLPYSSSSHSHHLLPVPFPVILQSSASLIPRERVSLSCGRHSASDKRIYQTRRLASLSLTPLILHTLPITAFPVRASLLTLSHFFLPLSRFSWSSISCDRSSVAERIIVCHAIIIICLSRPEDDVLRDLSKSHFFSLFFLEGKIFLFKSLHFLHFDYSFQFSSPLSPG